ncbi:MAG: Spy/CpxP family protein refolding chaperone [Hyphomonadaceae bacterium]|nr:Spy/CpxP family protein refolding chaperone [Hyphomonadaceae bacterium]
MRTSIVVAALSLLLAGCVHGAMGPGPHAGARESSMQMMAGMGAMAGCPHARHDAEAHLAHVRAALSITPDQEAAWNAYAAAYREHAGSMPMHHGGGPGMGHTTGSAPERMRHHEEMMASHLDSMRALRASLEALYAVLTPEQRTAADALECGSMHAR